MPILRHVHQLHGDKVYNLDDPLVRAQAEAALVIARAKGDRLLRIPGGDPNEVAQPLRDLSSLQPQDEALLLPPLTGG